MFEGLFESLQSRVRLYSRLLGLRKAIILRFFLCWAVGLASLLFDEIHNYDRRFQLRPTQSHADEIVLLMMTESDLNPIWGTRVSSGYDRDLLFNADDDVFWNQKTWEKALNYILAGSPRAVGVTLTYTDSHLSLDERLMKDTPIRDPRLLWSVQLRGDDRPIIPRFIAQNQQLVSHAGFPMDSDGTVRRFHESNPAFRHLTSNLAEMAIKGSASRYSPHESGSRLINFRGPAGSFKKMYFSRLIRGEYSPALFRDKIVILGIEGADRHLFRTPVGLITRAELVATVLDNIISDRWIQRVPFDILAMALFAILLMATYFILSFPHSVAFVLLFWFSIGITAGSLYLFDVWSTWTPLVTPLIQTSFTYVVFLTHMLNVKENRAWRLEQESKFFQKTEQLKTNFVSLISHDLKTPIAKIQAILDRQLLHPQTPTLNQDLLLIKRESQELNRYIESILKITQVESADFKLRRDAVDFNAIVLSTVSNLAPLCQLKRVRIETDLEPLFLIEADPMLLHEVILNLLENALKYTHEGTKVHASSFESEGHVVFTVRDEGPGIPISEQAEVFKKFYRGNGANKTAKGSGLGLYLVKYFIELHGGRVFLTSELGQGTTVGFHLPMAEAHLSSRTEGAVL